MSYYYDGNILLAEKDGNGKLQKVYINDGQGIIGMVRYFYDDSGTLIHKQRLYYLYDALGSVSLVTGEDGKPLQEYLYTPYGSTYNTESDKNNALRFVGRYGGYADDDTGLIYFWHRWYDPRNGRWISRDPIKCYKGTPYNYVNNSPINKRDFSGLSPDILDIENVTAHGNWCGKNRTGVSYSTYRNSRNEPIDGIDSCCEQHDICLSMVDSQPSGCKSDKDKQRRKCNRDLVMCAANNLQDQFSWNIILVFDIGINPITLTPGLGGYNPSLPGGGTWY